MGRQARARAMKRVVEEGARQRFFYHSFPRRGDGSSARGLAVLSSIVESGFLLVPEIIRWQEPLLNGRLSEPFFAAQKRMCFTELTEAELPSHADRFGPFSLEFSTQSLRQLGAVPVFYVPRGTTDEYLESIGNALMARMLESEQLLERVAQLEDSIAAAASGGDPVALSIDGHAVVLPVTAGQAKDLLQVLLHRSQPARHLLNAMRASAGFLYPTEDLTYTDVLGYYRQREWRIVSAMVRRGTELSRPTTPEEIARLVSLDPEFFGREIEFKTGWATRASKSQVMREVSGRHVLTFARRLYCPKDAVERANAILSTLPTRPEVVGT